MISKITLWQNPAKITSLQKFENKKSCLVDNQQKHFMMFKNWQKKGSDSYIFDIIYFSHFISKMAKSISCTQKYISVPWDNCSEFHMRFLSALCTVNIFNVRFIDIYLQCGDSDWKMKSTYLLAVVSKCILDLPT